MRYFLLMILCLYALPTWAVPDKTDVTAAMIYRLTKFIDWPQHAFPNTDAPFTICFNSATPTFEKLSNVPLKPWHGREVEVTSYVTEQCQVLVVESAEITEDIGPHTLLVGENISFLDDGGHIAFQFTRGRIGFHVNRTSAHQKGLTLSAELLSIARHVR